MAVNVLCLGAVGLGSVVLSVADRQGFFAKHGADVHLVPVTGTQVPDLSPDNPMGYIGAPAALMRAAAGVDLKILASFDSAQLSSSLIVSPAIRIPRQLRGKRLGARVTGAALWLHTVMALEHLKLDPLTDGIEILEIGDPAEIVKALEAGRIDGAVLSRAQCEQLTAKGFAIMLDLAPLRLHGASDALVVASDFLSASAEPKAILAAMIEAAAFATSADNAHAMLAAIKSTLKITDDRAAQSGLHELNAMLARKPYPSLDRLGKMQRMMINARPSVVSVAVADIMEDRLVRELDLSGYIDRTYASYALAPSSNMT